MELAVQTEEYKQIEAKLTGVAGELIEEANQCVAFDDRSLSACVDLCAKIKAHYKNVENERAAIVKPFNDGVKAINARFKQITEPLAMAESVVKKNILAYQAKRDAELKAEAEAKERALKEQMLAAAIAHEETGEEVQAAVAMKNIDRVHFKPETVGKGKHTEATSSLRRRWVFEVTDIKALATARPYLVQTNDAAIRAAISAGEREIPGLKIYQTTDVAIR